jgi:hypothetical protein
VTSRDKLFEFPAAVKEPLDAVCNSIAFFHHSAPLTMAGAAADALLARYLKPEAPVLDNVSKIEGDKWEFDAPKYFDFTDADKNDAENDKFFLSRRDSVENPVAEEEPMNKRKSLASLKRKVSWHTVAFLTLLLLRAKQSLAKRQRPSKRLNRLPLSSGTLRVLRLVPETVAGAFLIRRSLLSKSSKSHSRTS